MGLAGIGGSGGLAMRGILSFRGEASTVDKASGGVVLDRRCWIFLLLERSQKAKWQMITVLVKSN